MVLSRSRICANEEEFAQARVVTFVNPYSMLKIMQAGVSLDRFDKICVDGIGLLKFFHLVFRDSSIERLSFDFTGVASHVFERGAKGNERGFMLGSDPDSNTGFQARVIEMFPGINLEGRSGYFDNDDHRTEVLKTLADSSHDFILIGMGAVNQENVANQLVELGYTGRIYTCGGFMHQTAMSGGEYYPGWIDRFNLRFAYRMFKEPSTVRRYLLDYPKAFGLLALNIRNFRH